MGNPKALNFLAHTVYRDGIVLFSSVDRANMRHMEETAKECGEYSHCRRWEQGTLTNSGVVFRTEIRLPDLVLMTNTLNSIFDQHPIVTEASKLLIPIVAVVDSNTDPSLVTYPIPGNDDSCESVQLYLRLFKETIQRAKRARYRDFGGEITGEHKEEELRSLHSQLHTLNTDQGLEKEEEEGRSPQLGWEERGGEEGDEGSVGERDRQFVLERKREILRLREEEEGKEEKDIGSSDMHDKLLELIKK